MTKHDLPSAILTVALVVVMASPSTAGFLGRGSLSAMLQLAGIIDNDTALAVAQHWHW
jgi:hypothetical protein